MAGQEINKKERQQIERALLAAKGNEALYRRVQIVHLRAAHGMTQKAIAKAVGVSRSTVSRTHMAWFARGMASFKMGARGGSRYRYYKCANRLSKGIPSATPPIIRRKSLKPLSWTLSDKSFIRRDIFAPLWTTCAKTPTKTAAKIKSGSRNWKPSLKRSNRPKTSYTRPSRRASLSWTIA
ncbi:MAG: helix-turn-helix domain-containing protein [Alphaproteobacteria bacterium]|nr:helix-turn-helix domain-containing protein [Alphaproteobacteria bacterium]